MSESRPWTENPGICLSGEESRAVEIGELKWEGDGRMMWNFVESSDKNLLSEKGSI